MILLRKSILCFAMLANSITLPTEEQIGQWLISQQRQNNLPELSVSAFHNDIPCVMVQIDKQRNILEKINTISDISYSNQNHIHALLVYTYGFMHLACSGASINQFNLYGNANEMMFILDNQVVLKITKNSTNNKSYYQIFINGESSEHILFDTNNLLFPDNDNV